jgi:hypothetical protein
MNNPNDPESEFARRLVRRLDQGIADLRPGTVYRLRQARAAALAGTSTARGTVPELAASGAGGPSRRMAPRRSPAAWLGLALLVAAAGFGYQQWQAMQHEREYEDLDLHLLASDLPIDAYLDRGFQNWLRTGFER